MAHRRKSGDVEIPFVALMDTLTNVVGVLTIVFVMVGLGLANAVNNVFSSLPPATEEDIGAARLRLDQLRAAADPVMEKLKPLEKLNPADLKKLDAELDRLAREAAVKGASLPDLGSLKKDLSNREAELRLKKLSIEQLLAKAEQLNAALAKTPVYTPPPAKVVRIPASRVIPHDTKITPIFVTKEGAYALDTDSAKEGFIQIVN